MLTNKTLKKVVSTISPFTQVYSALHSVLHSTLCYVHSTQALYFPVSPLEGACRQCVRQASAIWRVSVEKEEASNESNNVAAKISVNYGPRYSERAQREFIRYR